jgi:gluconate 2-dehydrogenase gamma chain
LSCSAPRDLYRTAISEENTWCRQTHGKDFADLDGPTIDEMLGLLQANNVAIPSVNASELFIKLLANTKGGCLANPMYGGNRNMGGWKCPTMWAAPVCTGTASSIARHPRI